MVEEPEFTDVIQNVTVPAGRSVRLACSVKNLGSYKVTSLVSPNVTTDTAQQVDLYMYGQQRKSINNILFNNVPFDILNIKRELKKR